MPRFICFSRTFFQSLALGASLLAASAVLAGASPRPPTVDPTYGLPLPAPAKAPAAPVSQAQWIWAAATADNQMISLRRVFALNSVPKSATLYITADDFFTLYVNGKSVAQSMPDPKDINVWQQVHTVNVAPYLRPGKNVLAVQARNAAGAAGFLARLELPGQAAIETNAQWKVSGEAAPPAGWTGADFEDGGWQAATVIAPLEGGPWAGAGGLQGWPGYQEATAPYLAHLTLPVAHMTNVHPGAGEIDGADTLAGHPRAVLTVTPPPAGAADTPSVLLDFGREVAGRVMIQPLTPGVVLVGTGEDDAEAIKSPWGGQHRLSLVPGRPSATPYSAFRYARLVFPAGDAPAPIRLRVTLDDKYYPVKYVSSFDCSNPLLTKIWYTGAYTAHLCMQEDIWDAPKRDRARWSGDLHVSGEVISDVFADKFLMEQTLTRLRDDAGNGHVNGIPGYSCAWICTLADFQRHIGDTAYLNAQHDRLISLLEYLRGDLDERGVFANKHGAWPFVDWSPDFNGDHPPARAATHLFLVKAVRESVFLLREMGDKPSADKYAAWADTLTAAARQYLPDTTTNTYGNRLQENAMAIYSGVATPAQQDAIYRSVLTPDSPSWNKTGALLGSKPVMSPYYGNYVLFAMSEAGHNADAMRVMTDYWGGMLAQGATTFWEAYDPKWPKQDFHAHLQADDNEGYFVSLCHGWSAGPTSWLTERVLGVQPTGSGFQTAEIMPDLGGLAWAEGSVPTPYGLLHVRAEKTAGKMTLTLTIPPGVTATVASHGSALTVNGRRTQPLRIENGRACLQLTAGTYHLQSSETK